jgi:hypothetical protein
VQACRALAEVSDLLVEEEPERDDDSAAPAPQIQERWVPTWCPRSPPRPELPEAVLNDILQLMGNGGGLEKVAPVLIRRKP